MTQSWYFKALSTYRPLQKKSNAFKPFSQERCRSVARKGPATEYVAAATAATRKIIAFADLMARTHGLDRGIHIAKSCKRGPPAEARECSTAGRITPLRDTEPVLSFLGDAQIHESPAARGSRPGIFVFTGRHLNMAFWLTSLPTLKRWPRQFRPTDNPPPELAAEPQYGGAS